MSTTQTRQTRASQLEQLADAMADQLHVTDPEQRTQILSLLQERFNTDKPFLQYQPTSLASSRIFRADVRHSYIDILAFFAELQQMESTMSSEESLSEQTFRTLLQQVRHLRHQVISEDPTNTTRFEGFLDKQNKTLQHTVIEQGRLKLEPASVKVPGRVESAHVNVYPAPSVSDQIYRIDSGTVSHITSDGVGTGIWSTRVFCEETPSVIWNYDLSGDGHDKSHQQLQGMLIDVTLEYQTAIAATVIKGNLLTPARLFRAYAGQEFNGQVTWSLLTQRNSGNFLRSDVASEFSVNTYSPSSRFFRLVFHVPHPLERTVATEEIQQAYSLGEVVTGLLDGQESFQGIQTVTPTLEYLFGIYNLEISDTRYWPTGTCQSPAYTTTNGALTGISLDSPNLPSETPVIYTADFNGPNGVVASLPIIPKGQEVVTEAVTLRNTTQTDITEDLTAMLSFPVAENTTLQSQQTATLYHNSFLGIDAAGTGLQAGDTVTVTYTVAPQTALAYTDAARTQFYRTPEQVGTTPIITRLHPDTYAILVD